MSVDFQHLVGAVIDDHVRGRGPAVTGHQDAIGKLERENGGRLRLRSPAEIQR
jgi:hypothetical protein